MLSDAEYEEDVRARILAGDSPAFSRLAEDVGPSLAATLFRLFPNCADVEAFLQDALFELWNLRANKGDDMFPHSLSEARGWLYCFCTSRVLDWHRKQSRRRTQRVDDLDSLPSPLDAEQRLEDTNMFTDVVELVRREAGEQVASMVREYATTDKTHAEVAAEHGLSESAYSNRRTRYFPRVVAALEARERRHDKEDRSSGEDIDR